MAYLTFAAYAWFDFTRINHDGLANVGLFLMTAPIALVDAVMTSNGWGSLQPHGHGYLTDHALYYVPAVAVTALLLGIVASAIVRVFRRADPGPS
jgi:hypothetical protein